MGRHTITRASCIALALLALPTQALAAEGPIKDVEPSGITDIAGHLSRFAYTLFDGVTKSACQFGDWLLGFVLDSADTIMSQGFYEGTYHDFFQIARAVSSQVFEPVALGALGIVLAIAMLRNVDPRLRTTGDEGFKQILWTIAVFGMCYFLITHAIDLAAGIYTMGRNLMDLTVSVMEPWAARAETGLYDAIYVGGYQTTTYEAAGYVLVWMLIALISAAVSVSTAFSIITTCLLRMAEVYLRAAISPLALALLLDERTRQAGMVYVKRYLALILQAAIIVIALALGPLFFAVGTTILSGLPVEEGFVIGNVLKTIIPTLCSIVIINQIVTRSEQVANSMFGLV
ncbi:MAG: hypothetical protein SOU51_01090 [Collinsella sp.]|nr:hypothetical protein [Collinsella sp.]